MSGKTIVVVSNSSSSSYIFRGCYIDRLLSDGYRVVVYSKFIDRFSNELEEKGVEHLVGLSLGVLFRLYREASKAEFVHSFTHLGNVISLLLPTNTRRVLTFTGFGIAWNRSGLGFGLARWVLRQIYILFSKRVYSVIAQNQVDFHILKYDWYAATGVSVYQTFGSGIDSSLTKGTVAKLPRSFGFCGRAIKEKGIDFFYELARSCRGRYSFIHCGYLSETHNEEWLSSVVDCDVDYWGVVDDMDAFYKQVDVLVLPTEYREGTPRSVLEAIKHKKIIVAASNTVVGALVSQLEVGFTASTVAEFDAKLEAYMSKGIEQISFNFSEALKQVSDQHVIDIYYKSAGLV